MVLRLPKFQITAITQAGQKITFSVDYTGKSQLPGAQRQAQKGPQPFAWTVLTHRTLVRNYVVADLFHVTRLIYQQILALGPEELWHGLTAARRGKSLSPEQSQRLARYFEQEPAAGKARAGRCLARQLLGHIKAYVSAVSLPLASLGETLHSTCGKLRSAECGGFAEATESPKASIPKRRSYSDRLMAFGTSETIV